MRDVILQIILSDLPTLGQSEDKFWTGVIVYNFIILNYYCIIDIAAAYSMATATAAVVVLKRRRGSDDAAAAAANDLNHRSRNIAILCVIGNGNRGRLFHQQRPPT